MKKILLVNLITLVCMGCASLNISGDLTMLDLPRHEINKNTNEGEVIAETQDGFEIARTRIKDGRFKIILNELPAGLLKPLRDIYNDGWSNLQISDPEAKAANLEFCVTFGAFFDTNDGIKKETFWFFIENGKGHHDRYYYIYSNKNVSVYGEGEGDIGYTNGLIFKYRDASVKRILDINLKRGWNRIKYFIFYNGKDIIQKTENTKEVFQGGPFVWILGGTKYLN
jgi:hypothetical protein